MKFKAAMFGLLLATGCGSGPTSPSSVTETVLQYPSELAPVIRKLDTDSWIHPMIGEPMSVWVRRHIRQIKWDSSLKAPYLAYAYPDGTIGWSSQDRLPTYDTPDVALSAAYVLHEARHLQGYSHTCGDKDRTFEEGGAWAVHITYLEHAGFQKEADLVRQAFIGC